MHPQVQPPASRCRLEGRLTTPAEPRRVFERNLEEIERIIRWISRRTCLAGDDAEEFRSWVMVRVMDNDFAILRSHSGRSSLATYLTTVVHNLARDYRVQRWGRWRPSVAAERLGVVGVQLETMMRRDGFSLGAATEMLRRHHGVKLSAVEIATLAERLPDRTRVTFESGQRLERAPAREQADEGAMRSEGREALSDARAALRESLAELDVEDRLILKLHYESGLTIAAIASSLGLEQRSLYSRRDASLRKLRSALESRGIEASRALEALAWSEDEGELDFEALDSEGSLSGPSNHNEPRGTSRE